MRARYLAVIACASLALDAAGQTQRPTGIQKLTPSLRVDYDKERLILDAEVVLRKGPLELLLCPKGTKEHEAILAATVNPQHFHFALLLIGAKPGSPARFNPFRPPHGQRLKITLETADGAKQTIVDARQWIRDDKGKPLDADFVFAGSRFYKPPGLGRPIYMGNDGDLVCIVNFPGSVVDIARESSKDNASLIYEAWTERIPPEGTKVRVIFEPINGDDKVEKSGR